MEIEKCTCSTDLEAPPEQPTRRSILGWMVTGINLAVIGALAVPAVQFVLAPLRRSPKQHWVDVLGTDDLKIGETREIAYTMEVKDGYQIVDRKYTAYLHRSAEGLKCFDPACTHLGCRIKFQDDQRRYFCPCHGGVFSEDGQVVSGPPPNGLVEYPVKVEDGRILVSRQV